MNIKDIKSVYFVGAGGIGMSAIARYFIKKGLVVAGYDKTPSTLTRQLEREGMLFIRPLSLKIIRNCVSSVRMVSRFRNELKC